MSITSAIIAGTLRGTVRDNTGEPLPDATVRLLMAPDSAFVSGVAADVEGRFNLQGVKKGRYIVQANYIGYAPQYRNVTVSSPDATVDVPAFSLSESSIVLKETTVVGVKTPIKVMEDTVEFNADSYKTQPNAVVEDLLKRLPGVEVGTDGSITANGQTVKKILVDGKEFFSDDPAVASKNLPVDMVDKLQVVQRKSDLARLTGVDDGEDETVINLTVKKGMNNGWFGTVEGGYGTDERYKGAFVVNRFWNGNQFTVLGNANNINDAGFTDGNGNRFRRFGGSNGINTTQSLGINFNIGKEEIVRVGGDVMYSHNDRDTRTKSHRENLLADLTTIEDQSSLARDKGHNIRGDFRVLWNADSFNTVEFRPNLSININDSESYGTSHNYNANSAEISNARTITLSNGKSYEFGGRLIYNYKFKKRRGRSISFFGNYQLSNVHETERSWSRNAFWQLDSLYEDYQEIKDHRWTNNVNARISWTEPLGNPANGNFLQLAYRVQYRWNNSDQNVYHDPFGQKPIPDDLRQLWADNRLWDTWGLDDRMTGWGDLTFDNQNSSQFRNEYFTQSINFGYKKVNKKYNLDAGISINPQMTDSRELLNPQKSMSRWVWNYAPYLRFRYKFSKQTTLNMDYFGRSSQPTIQQMQPVEDSSDPLNIIQGNRDLDPSFAHNVRARFQSFDMDRQQSIMVMMDGSMTQNSIVSKVTYNRETGGRYTTYENVDGVWSARLFSMFSRPLN
ncbi:MAG: outer membrane beta-barrel protein, partial [Muribaculaceae bacterium]|nr:outer membrane beta-barrel protein [Muribaculaceae bacterium]